MVELLKCVLLTCSVMVPVQSPLFAVQVLAVQVPDFWMQLLAEEHWYVFVAKLW